METTDNNLNQPLSLEKAETIDLQRLQRLADTPIDRLISAENRNLLVFPHSFAACDDDVGRSSLFTLKYGTVGNGFGPVSLLTGNIMGFVGIGDTRLSIRSRFAREGEKDFFLHYMLQQVFSINLFDLKFGTDADSIFDFLLYLFPRYFKGALSQGVYKEYCRKNRNDTQIKGAIDLPRHLRRNVPFNGKAAYTTREFSYDNHLTQLIRHTIEYIRSHRTASRLLNSDPEIREYTGQITSATPAYERNDRHRIVLQNLRPVRHPYFSRYTALQRICLQILRHDGLRYGKKEDKIYGILFDGAWLWEEYLGIMLHRRGFQHPENKKKKGGTYLFRNDRYIRYPDFYLKDTLVLDAKYKFLNENEIDRNDLHQLIAYMHMLNIPSGGFIAPCASTNEVCSCIRSSVGTLRGTQDKTVQTYTFPIPRCGDWQTFRRRMTELENEMLAFLPTPLQVGNGG